MPHRLISLTTLGLVLTVIFQSAHSPPPVEPLLSIAQPETAPRTPIFSDVFGVLLPAPEPIDDVNLSSEEPGLGSNLESALPEIDRLDKQTVDAAVTQDNLGQPNDSVELPQFLPARGAEALFRGRVRRPTNMGGVFGAGGGWGELLRANGGNADSERAVALGLAWLAKQQKQDGGWEYDQGHKEERVAATGMALLPFLAAGCTHKNNDAEVARKPAKYKDTVGSGLAWLQKQCAPSGPNAGRMSTNMYAQGIGTIALCEAYGMTKDPGLQPFAQAAINYIQKAQGPNGSWGYSPNINGDISIVGWQLQALFTARGAKLAVDDEVIRKAVKFLNSAAAGQNKSMYGYQDSAGAAPSTALTAVGLWCRARIDNWGPAHPGMVDGVAGLMKNGPRGRGEIRNLYYYYYATQVVRHSGGDVWATWNEGPKGADGIRKGGMRDWLVLTQVRKVADKIGSWDPEGGWFGSGCGRLGTTCMCLLTLEVYYRYAPAEKRAEKPAPAPDK
jgi:hypothetical protein